MLSHQILFQPYFNVLKTSFNILGFNELSILLISSLQNITKQTQPHKAISLSICEFQFTSTYLFNFCGIPNKFIT